MAKPSKTAAVAAAIASSRFMVAKTLAELRWCEHPERKDGALLSLGHVVYRASCLRINRSSRLRFASGIGYAIFSSSSAYRIM